MKRYLTLAVLLLVGASFVTAQEKEQDQNQNRVKTMEQTQNQPKDQNRNRVQTMEQTQLKPQFQYRYVDKTGDGLNSNMFQHSWKWAHKLNKGYGPGDGAGNQGSGPKDGTGFGPGKGTGSGECDGTGPKGSNNRRGRGGR
jgi:hypothetical protein